MTDCSFQLVPQVIFIIPYPGIPVKFAVTMLHGASAPQAMREYFAQSERERRWTQTASARGAGRDRLSLGTRVQAAPVRFEAGSAVTALGIVSEVNRKVLDSCSPLSRYAPELLINACKTRLQPC